MQGRRLRAPVLAAALLAGVIVAIGCEGPQQGTVTTQTPPESEFAPVSVALQYGCGSLDCHGHVARNLRVYGEYGLRLREGDEPGGEPTTQAEHQKNFAALVTLEPEVLERVVAEGGQRPERLTLVRKARGTEFHGGSDAAPRGGPLDRCLVSWLSSQTDDSACAQASRFDNPFAPPADAGP